MSESGPAVIVLDGEQRAALAGVRSLGRRGCVVNVGATVRNSLAGGSRFAAGEALLPDPLSGVDKYCAAVARLAADHRADIILPVTEPSTLALLERGGQFAGASIPTSDLAHFRRASNKAEVLSVAKTLGLDVPDQWAVSSAPGLIPEIPLDQFPVVVKPSRSVVGPEGRRHKTEVSYAATPEQLQSLVATLVADSGPPLVQPRVEGPGVGIFMLRWGGEILASFAHRRIREKPPSGGVSVCCESVAPPPELLAQSAALLAALDWTGVAMIEYKLDTRSNRHYLMEVNPRFWGSLQLAIDAGVDFPWLLIQLALGRTIEPVHRWRIGLRSRWLFGELDHLIARLRHSPADLNLPRDAPGLFRTAAGTLSPCWPGERSDVFRLTDPVPAFREAIAWFRDL